MRGLIALAVRRPVSVLMFALATVAFGVVAYQRLAVDLFPDIAYPSITIQTELPDAAPQEVETMVTRPVEEAVGVLRGLERIRSVSRSGVSEVSLELAWGSDMSSVAMDVREKLDRLVLPDEAEDPVVLRFDPALDPIVRLALTGPGALTALRDLAERKLEPDLETVPGVAAAELFGGLEEEIRVEIDQERLAALGLGIADLELALGDSNVNLPGGTLRGAERQFLVRTLNELDSVEEIAELVIREQDGRAVTLGDVADVFRGAKERETITRANGEECVQIAIYKEGDANTVEVTRALDAWRDKWKDDLPKGYALTVLSEQARFIEQAVEGVRDATLLGGIVAILVLLLFLRDVRSTVVIATAIPLSIIATFVAMYQLGVSLNVMSLGGLTLGIGMLVDNAIVVLESIDRRRREGLPRARAAVEGAAEVGAAVVASTLTTIAVFLPIVFVEGVAGQLFSDQAITVTMSLLASLLVALTLIPMLSARGRTRPPRAGEATARLGPAGRIYDRLLRAALRHRALTLLTALALLAVSLYAGRALETELIPKLRSGAIFFDLTMPAGTALAATDRVAQRMEAAASADDRVAQHFTTVGLRQVAGGLSIDTKGEHLAQLDVRLAPGADAAREEALGEDLRAAFRGLPGAEIRLGRPTFFSLETPIEIAVFGEDLETLRGYSLDLAERLEAEPGFVDVRASLEAGNPELQIVFDRRRVAALGLELGPLSRTLASRVQGAVPTRFREADRQIDVRVLNAARTRDSVEDIAQLVLPGPDGQPIRLLSVAEVRPALGPAEIHRLQQQRAALVSANLSDISLGAGVRTAERVLAERPPGSDITAEIGGQNREMQTSFRSLWFAVALAIFLVYLVMASTFESLVHPFVVLFTVPLALIGVIGGLLATATPVTVIVLIGAVMLVGIVVNNAIVLIDAINRLRREGTDKLEAVVRAGHLRLRPILMTTLTTSLALVPMALGGGEGGELRAPLGITVAAGLLASTLLTLVVIPAAYMIVPSRVEPEPDV